MVDIDAFVKCRRKEHVMWKIYPLAIMIVWVLPYTGVAEVESNHLISLKAGKTESTRVIVKFKPPLPHDGAKLGELSTPLNYIQARYAGESYGQPQTLGVPDLVVAEVSPAGVESLKKDPNVLAIFEDTLSRPNWTGAKIVENLKDFELVNGEGNLTGIKGAIAIVDTGVNSNHPFLKGKLIREACFSSITSSYPKAKSLCPNALETQIMEGAARDCDHAVSGCGHGTHVGGIAVGGPVTLKEGKLQGAAPDAKLIALQVYSQFDDPTLCGEASSPCALSFASDQIRALNYLYSISKEVGLAVVNMSMGHGAFSTECADDILSGSIKKLIDANVAVVASSGNEGLIGYASSPACIPDVISVGAVDKSNRLAYSYSNTAATTTLLALGDDVLSADQEGGYRRKTGTSMAAPQVSGAVAILRSKLPKATVTDLVGIMKARGTEVIDKRTGQKLTALNIASLAEVAVGMAVDADDTNEVSQIIVGGELPSRVVVIPQDDLELAPAENMAAELRSVTGKVTEVKDREDIYIIEMKGGVTEGDKAAIKQIFGEKSKISTDTLSVPQR